MSRGRDVFTIDVEDWFHILGLPSSNQIKGWSGLETRVERNFIELLDILDETNTKATCFMLGWVAENFPNAVKEAHRRGHELASHGYGHQLISHQSRDEFRADIRKSKDLIEQITGVPVVGYRAPSFSITQDTVWALDELVQAGYKYDSSIFPTKRDNGGISGAQKAPHQLSTPSGPIWEFPISVANFMGKELCFFGGGYLRLFPYALIRGMSEQVSRSGRPVIYYIHPREIDPSHPRLPMGPVKRFKSYVNLGTTKGKLKSILRDRNVTSFRDWMAQEKPAKKAWSARPYRAGDEKQILELFSLVFGGSQSLEHWTWLFPKNPFSRPIVYVAENPEGRIVGHYCLIPTPIRREGKRTLAALSIQSMIDPGYQRQGILKALEAAGEKQLVEDGIEMGITFLNDNSLHAYTKYFGWTELENGCPIHFAVLDAKGPIQKVLKSSVVASALAPFVNFLNGLVAPGRKARSDSVQIRTVETFGPQVDSLWSRFSSGIPHTVERDSQYLNWRLAEKPATYRLMIAEAAGETLGVAVTKKEKKFGLDFGYLVELFHDPSRLEVAELLAAEALRGLKEEGCSMATALTLGPPSILKALRRCGFFRLPKAAMPHGIHFCFKDRIAGSKTSFSTSKWFLSWSDHDVV